MISWDTLLNGYIPLSDTTNSWDFLGSMFSFLGGPNNEASFGETAPYLQLPWIIFSITFGNNIANLMLLYIWYVIPVCIFLALLWWMGRPLMFMSLNNEKFKALFKIKK